MDMQYVNKLCGVFRLPHGVTEFEGIGIGLLTVVRTVCRHGGRVSAQGKVNEGAT
jgi:two-component system, chemotaxis family, sensor kinase Cph1